MLTAQPQKQKNNFKEIKRGFVQKHHKLDKVHGKRHSKFHYKK